MNLIALLLADSRFPGGGHAHSGGLEEAAARGLVSTEDDLPGFLLGRLRTAGELAAVFAAAAAHAARRGVRPDFWSRLDAELDARTPSAAQRESSRAQGSGTLRALRASVHIYDKSRPLESAPERQSSDAPGADHVYDKSEFLGGARPDANVYDKSGLLEEAPQRESSRAQGRETLPALRAAALHVYDKSESSSGSEPSSEPRGRSLDVYDKCGLGPRPHHCVVVGVAVGLGGGLPVDAALTAAYLSVSGPASAAVRLLGLDPFAVNGAIVGLSGELAAVAERAAGVAARDPAELPAPGAPALDLFAEAHRRKHEKEVRLFAS